MHICMKALFWLRVGLRVTLTLLFCVGRPLIPPHADRDALAHLPPLRKPSPARGKSSIRRIQNRAEGGFRVNPR